VTRDTAALRFELYIINSNILFFDESTDEQLLPVDCGTKATQFRGGWTFLGGSSSSTSTSSFSFRFKVFDAV